MKRRNFLKLAPAITAVPAAALVTESATSEPTPVVEPPAASNPTGLATFEIELPSVAYKGKVFMNGAELKGVRSLQLDASASGSSLTLLTMTFIPHQVLVRLNDPQVVAKIQELTKRKQEVTHVGQDAEHRIYARGKGRKAKRSV